MNMDNDLELHLLGVSFRCAPAEVRQHLSFASEDAKSFLEGFNAEFPQAELCILSTCNRTEFYLVDKAPGNVAAALLARLKRLRPHAACLDEACEHYLLEGEQAIEHLFRVVCRLDSAILGDMQITGQVRGALNIARRAGSSGKFLEQSFGQALKLGARARSQTDISAGSAGVAAAVAGLFFARHAESSKQSDRSGRRAVGSRQTAESDLLPTAYCLMPTILLIGAGEIVESVGRLLHKRGFGKLTFVNRTAERAQRVALRCGGETLPWEQLVDGLVGSDFVLVATSAPEPILTLDLLSRVAEFMPSGHRPVIVDAGLPPNVERGCDTHYEVVGIDAIRERQDDSLNRRGAAVSGVEAMIKDELDAWRQWLRLRPMENLIKSLYLEADGFAEQLIDRPAADTAADLQSRLDIQRTLKKLLHSHVSRLRRFAASAR
jgi:glutamyl-tRNA reductase